MARPCKSSAVYNGKISKEDKEIRLKTEQIIKGNNDSISPPDYLNTHQKELFNYIVDQLKASGILGNLDIYMLSSCVIAIDRMQEIETMINNDFELIRDKDLMSAKDKYTKEFFRCCNEVSLSPQARAKLANINVQAKQKEEDPLLKILAGGKK